MYMLTWLGDIKVLKGIGVRFPEPVRLEIIFPPVAAFFYRLRREPVQP